jgi:hypothetical protein
MKIYVYTVKLISSVKRANVDNIEQIQRNIGLDCSGAISKSCHLISIRHLDIICKAYACLDMFQNSLELIVAHFKVTENSRMENYEKIEELKQKIKISMKEDDYVKKKLSKELGYYIC